MSSMAYWAIIKKDDKGNFMGISRCGHNEPYISLELEKQLEYRYSFKYDLLGKLSEIKTEEHLYKIEWLR